MESAINALSSYPAISTRIAVTASFDSFDIKIVVASACHFAYYHLQSHSDIPKLLSIGVLSDFCAEGIVFISCSTKRQNSFEGEHL